MEQGPFDCSLANQALISSRVLFGRSRSLNKIPLFDTREEHSFPAHSPEPNPSSSSITPLHFFEGELRGRYLSVEGRRESAERHRSAITIYERLSAVYSLLRDNGLLKEVAQIRKGIEATYHGDYHRSSEGAREPHGLSCSHHKSGNVDDKTRLPCSVSCSVHGLGIETCGVTAGCWAAKSHFPQLAAELQVGRP